MSISFLILAALTLGGAVAAMALRNLVHCALSLAVTFAGLAGLYLQLNAQFVGFAQVLIYIGAVAILIVFAILLTRSTESNDPAPARHSGWLGLIIALLVAGCLVGAVLRSVVTQRATPPAPNITVQQIGTELMGRYVLPLEVLGLLLTAALIGAVVIAISTNPHDRRE